MTLWGFLSYYFLVFYFFFLITLCAFIVIPSYFYVLLSLYINFIVFLYHPSFLSTHLSIFLIPYLLLFLFIFLPIVFSYLLLLFIYYHIFNSISLPIFRADVPLKGLKTRWSPSDTRLRLWWTPPELCPLKPWNLLKYLDTPWNPPEDLPKNLSKSHESSF